MKNQNQEAFTIMVKHLRKQGRQATSSDEVSVAPSWRMCQYRGEWDTKCAVGVLIADEHYEPDIEGLAAADAPVRDALYYSGWNDISKGLLLSMQAVHDNCTNFTLLDAKLEDIAETWGLTLP